MERSRSSCVASGESSWVRTVVNFLVKRKRLVCEATRNPAELKLSPGSPRQTKPTASPSPAATTIIAALMKIFMEQSDVGLEARCSTRTDCLARRLERGLKRGLKRGFILWREGTALNPLPRRGGIMRGHHLCRVGGGAGARARVADAHGPIPGFEREFFGDGKYQGPGAAIPFHAGGHGGNPGRRALRILCS